MGAFWVEKVFNKWGENWQSMEWYNYASKTKWTFYLGGIIIDGVAVFLAFLNVWFLRRIANNRENCQAGEGGLEVY